MVDRASQSAGNRSSNFAKGAARRACRNCSRHALYHKQKRPDFAIGGARGWSEAEVNASPVDG